jgi:hypothetical protein
MEKEGNPRRMGMDEKKDEKIRLCVHSGTGKPRLL